MIIAGKFEVIGELGRGGMGYVYQVRHRDLDAVFALKVLLPHLAADPSLVARFQHEARIMAKLSHPNIVRVFDIDRDGELYYFVMEYVAGRHLGQIIEQEGAFAPAAALAVASQIAAALDYAHARRPAVIHRDIKPSNVMIEDGTGRVVVTDFGIAKLMDDGNPSHTRTGFMVGTLRYAAPEQIRADPSLDGRADLYALGLVLYEMLGGQKLFEGMTNQAIIGQQLYEPAEHKLAFARPVPPALRSIIRKAVMKKRAERYSSAAAFAADLQALDTGPTTRLAVTQTVKRPSRSPLRGLIALLVLGALAVLFWPRPEAPNPAVGQREPTPTAAAKPDIAALPAAEPLPPPATKPDIAALPPTAPVVHPAEIKPAEPTPPQSTPAAPTAASPPAACEPPLAADLNRWLEDYRRAREQKNIASLRELGYLQSDEAAERLRRTLEGRQRYQIEIDKPQAITEGGALRLRFDQVERWYDQSSYSTVMDYSTQDVALPQRGCVSGAAHQP